MSVDPAILEVYGDPVFLKLSLAVCTKGRCLEGDKQDATGGHYSPRKFITNMSYTNYGGNET